MKKQILVGLMALGLASVSLAANTNDKYAGAEMKPVDKMRTFNQIDGWRPINRDTLIIWATPFKPYLVELTRPTQHMRFEQTIGVTSTAGTVYAKFDDVIVDGIRYPIKAMYEIDRFHARHMKGWS